MIEEVDVKAWMWEKRYDHMHMCHINVSSLKEAAMQEFGEHYSEEKLKELAIEASQEHLDRVKDYCS